MIDDEVNNNFMNGRCLIAHLHNDLDASSLNLKFRKQSIDHQFISSRYSVSFPQSFEMIECSLEHLVVDMRNFLCLKGMLVVLFRFQIVLFYNMVVLAK